MGKTPFIDFRGTYDNELHMKKTAGTQEEAKKIQIMFGTIDSYDPDWGEEPLQKTKGIQYTEFVAPLIKWYKNSLQRLMH